MINRPTLDSILPKQGKGRKRQIFLATSCQSEKIASRLYQYLKLSLLDVNAWNEKNTEGLMKAMLSDKLGRHIGRIAQPGDKIKLSLPRWQSAGKLYDWREIKKVEERLSGNIEIFYLTIIPASNPVAEKRENSHFLKQESSLTIFIVRDEHKVELQVHTRNESLNLHDAGLKTKIQLAVMGVFIAGGIYEHHWAKLLKSILEDGHHFISL